MGSESLKNDDVRAIQMAGSESLKNDDVRDIQMVGSESLKNDDGVGAVELTQR